MIYVLSAQLLLLSFACPKESNKEKGTIWPNAPLAKLLALRCAVCVVLRQLSSAWRWFFLPVPGTAIGLWEEGKAWVVLLEVL